MEGSPRGEPPRLHGVVKHLTMALVAMVIYGALHIPLGRIPVANGAGWDGIDYVAMLEKGWRVSRPAVEANE